MQPTRGMHKPSLQMAPNSLQPPGIQPVGACPPPLTAQSRGIVLPSPDLLYSVCVFDVSQGPVRVTANRDNFPGQRRALACTPI